MFDLRGHAEFLPARSLWFAGLASWPPNHPLRRRLAFDAVRNVRPDHAGRSCSMPWILGSAAIYIVLLITLGVLTLRKGHWVMFIIGIFLPLFWLIGAIIPPVRTR
jgi:hypothetical protein